MNVKEALRHYLIVYNVQTRELQTCEFDNSRDASVARAKKESELSAPWEIVVLSAPTLEELRKTHSRYFMSAAEILQRSADQLESRSSL